MQANAAEHVTSVWMAMKNKMELTIGICVGSSIVRSIHIFSWRFTKPRRICVSKSPPSSYHFSWLLAGCEYLTPKRARCRLLTRPVACTALGMSSPFSLTTLRYAPPSSYLGSAFLVPVLNVTLPDRCLFCLCASCQPSSPVRSHISFPRWVC